jgi:hypothetical protein
VSPITCIHSPDRRMDDQRPHPTSMQFTILQCIFLTFHTIAASQIAVGKQATLIHERTDKRLVYLVRHAEEPEHEVAGFNGYPYGQDDLDPVGFVRSLCFVHEFGAKSDIQFKTLAAQYPKHSRRGVETLTPLAYHLRLPIQTPAHKDDVKKLIKWIKHEKRFPMLITWWGRVMPNITQQLGVPLKNVPGWPHSWKGSSQVWIIDLDAKTVIVKHMHCKPQRDLHEAYCLRSIWQPGPTKPHQGKWPPYSSRATGLSDEDISDDIPIQQIPYDWILLTLLATVFTTLFTQHLIRIKC